MGVECSEQVAPSLLHANMYRVRAHRRHDRQLRLLSRRGAHGRVASVLTNAPDKRYALVRCVVSTRRKWQSRCKLKHIAAHVVAQLLCRRRGCHAIDA
jgi:hypothetical protein